MLESYFYRARVATQNLPHIAKQLRRFWRGACEERLIFCMRQPQEKKRERADWRGMRFAAGKTVMPGMSGRTRFADLHAGVRPFLARLRRRFLLGIS